MSNLEEFIAHHEPPVKVGGRRYSITKHHHHHHGPNSTATSNPAEPAAEDPAPNAGGAYVDDYPRPNPPDARAQQDRNRNHSPPRHDGELESASKSNDEWKYHDKPSKAVKNVNPTQGKIGGGGGRIGQPAKEMHI